MRSDNNSNKTMYLNRFLAQGKSLLFFLFLLDIFMFLLLNYIVNVSGNLDLWIHDTAHPEKYFAFSNVWPRFSEYSLFLKRMYVIFAFMMLILDGILAYQIRVSFSESEINTGSEGTSRWTYPFEVKRQYKAIPLADGEYEGRGGTIVSRIGNMLYVDDSASHTLVIGTTRSGKGQMYVIPTIDAYSRAKKLKDKPSMLISDPKLELYKMFKKILEVRGYIVRLFNLNDPQKSMGYDPIYIVKRHYKEGRLQQAQMAARAFVYSIFHAHDDTDEKIWKNTATSLYTSLIVGLTDDGIRADKELNAQRKICFEEKQKLYTQLSAGEKAEADKSFAKLKEKLSDEELFLSEELQYIPESEIFYEIYPNEKKVNCYSCIQFFKELCDRISITCETEDEEEFKNEFGKKAETALDDYFNQRPKRDYAKALYQEIKVAGGRTKGSVYITMQSALSTFSLEGIAQMTAENDIDIEELGYGDKPIAIFMCIPYEDRSNHFLATTLIAQVNQYLSQLANSRTGKLKRAVKQILDEGGNLPIIENMEGFTTVGLGIGISIDLYLQSYNQIYGRYKESAKTILDNFANQIYIMSLRSEGAEEFSELLGNRTIIEVERNGGRFSLHKTYMERPKQKPLMPPDELGRLKEGECVIYRGIKRSDRLGVAVESFPIINEYLEKLKVINIFSILISMIYSRIFLKKARSHPTEERLTSWSEELRMRVNDMKRYHGTALLYAYQYLDLPDPNSMSIDEICDESRAHINLDDYIIDADKVLEQIKDQFLEGKPEIKAKEKFKKAAKPKTICFKDLGNFAQVKVKLMDTLGKDYENKLAINKDSHIQSVKNAVLECDELDEKEKNSILLLISKG